ncbi:MAG TPA: CPXCG motif-containing cysteine-rich protein [Bdellovibrionota bacterium]|nr:CPXCG motif-containing cysteine-rich protein [Bdellovibrionota bacterium]
METAVQCPYCFEDFTIVVDCSVEGVQSYIEDCYVCCRPIQFRVECAEGAEEPVSVEAGRT